MPGRELVGFTPGRSRQQIACERQLEHRRLLLGASGDILVLARIGHA